MTLTEFLLARIAEDEEFAECVPHLAVFNRDRIRAECEAKRRIVDTADRMILDADDPESEMSAKERFFAVSCAMVILRGLAAVHADHPDYCEEWKP